MSLFDGIRYPANRLYEDAHTLPMLLRKAHLVATTEEGLYYYASNPDGITMDPDGRGLPDLLDAHVQQLHDLGLANQLTEYYSHVLNIQLDVYRFTRQTPIIPVPKFSSSDRRHLPVNHKTQLKLRMLNLLGIKNLCKIHRLLLPRRNNH